MFTMLAQLRRCGIHDDVAQWHSLDTFLHSLTMFSTCWHYCFPGLPPPSIPADEYESIAQLPWLGLILEVLVVVRIALQIPTHAMSQSQHTVANRYELHRCRCTAYLLISFFTHAVANFYNYFGDVMPSSNLRFTTGSDPTLTGFSVPFRSRSNISSVWVQESKWQYLLRPHLNAPWVHRLLRKVGFREHLVDFRRHSLSSPTSLGLHKRFRRRPHPDLQRQLRPEMLDDIQAHYSTLYQLGSNTGASFQAMRDLLSAAFPPTQLYYFLRLSVFVNEPFRSKAQKLLAQVLRKRQLQSPSTLTQLLLPPLHVRNWKAQLGTWLQSWVASSHRDLFPSLFLPKIRVVETRSATLGDRLYNYRTWQRRWTPDASFRVAVRTLMITAYTVRMNMQ